MKKLSEKNRRILRMVYQGLGAVVMTFGFQGCYNNNRNSFTVMYGVPVEYGPGPGRGDDVAIHGTVRSKTEAPVLGIKVSIKDIPSCGYTNTDGFFNIYVPEQESYKIKFEDVDGAENGSFKTLKKKITLDDTGVSLNIYLDEADAE
jgi:putative lipoprotein (rSAM/lipoprotein system)